jgi:hypothetical protein
MRLKGRYNGVPSACAELKQSEQAQDGCTVLPLFPQMMSEDQHQVASAINWAVEDMANYASNPAGMFSE